MKDGNKRNFPMKFHLKDSIEVDFITW